MTKADLATIVVRLESDLKADLERLAQSDERSLNGYVVRVLRQHVAGADQAKKGKGK